MAGGITIVLTPDLTFSVTRATDLSQPGMERPDLV
jgi:hypothetical protein